MQSPTAVPRMPASASGVSTQRLSPKRSRSPAVARKTPPARPTSSPMTSTFSSRASSTWKPSLIASTIRSSAKPALPHPGRRLHVRVLEHELARRLRLGLCHGDAGAQRVLRLLLDRAGEVVAEQPQPPQVALVPTEALVLLLLLDALEIEVRARVVGGRVRRSAIRNGFDECRPAAAARALDRFARRLEDREHV